MKRLEGGVLPVIKTFLSVSRGIDRDLINSVIGDHFTGLHRIFEDGIPVFELLVFPRTRLINHDAKVQ